jgi:hypothetical protein
VNLTDLYEIAPHTSDYPTLPKLGESLSALLITILTVYFLLDQRNGDTCRETADLVNFHITQLAMSEIAPLLKGFCGDFVQGVEQMAGTVQTPLRTANTSKC